MVRLSNAEGIEHVLSDRQRVLDCLTPLDQTAREIAKQAGIPFGRTVRMLKELHDIHQIRHAKRPSPRKSGWIGVWWKEER